MYEMGHEDDPQYIGRALIRALEQVDRIHAREAKRQGASHPIVKGIVADHGIKNYHEKLAALGIAEPKQCDDK